MRREEAEKYPLRRLRLPDRVLIQYVPCSMGKHGRHAITLGLQDDLTVAHVSAGCSETDKRASNAIERLGGDSCLKVLRELKMHLTLKKGARLPEELENWGNEVRYSIPANVSDKRDRRAKALAESAVKKESAEDRWNRLLTQKATQAAGFPLRGERVAPSDDRRLERVLYFGSAEVAHRVNGKWLFNELEMARHIEVQPAKVAMDGKRCLACGREYRFAEPHARKSRHARNVIEGIKRAMWALRKPKGGTR